MTIDLNWKDLIQMISPNDWLSETSLRPRELLPAIWPCLCWSIWPPGTLRDEMTAPLQNYALTVQQLAIKYGERLPLDLAHKLEQ